MAGSTRGAQTRDFVMDAWAEIDALERNRKLQDRLLREAIAAQPDVSATERILAKLGTFHGAHPGETA